MYRGYVKLWRKTEDSAVAKDPYLLQLWCHLLMAAAYKEAHVTMQTGRGSTVVVLMPGQVLFGRKAWGSKLNQPPSSTWKRLKTLEKLGNVVTQAGTHFTVVTICNWEAYQNCIGEDEQACGHPSNRQVTGKGQASDRQVTHQKNLKNDKNQKEAQEALASDPEALFSETEPIRHQSTPEDQWRFQVSSQAWVRDLKRAGCKIGPKNWEAWEGLKERYSMEIITEASRKVPPADRFNDAVEAAIQRTRQDSVSVADGEEVIIL